MNIGWSDYLADCRELCKGCTITYCKVYDSASKAKDDYDLWKTDREKWTETNTAKRKLNR